MTNSIRACPIVVIDVNLIGYKTPNGMDAEKCVELLATILSSNGAVVLVYADHFSKSHDEKRESIRKK